MLRVIIITTKKQLSKRNQGENIPHKFPKQVDQGTYNFTLEA